MSLLQPARRERGIFLNPVPTVLTRPGTLLKSIKGFFTAPSGGTPDKPPGPFHTDAALYDSPPAGGLRVTWMGHSTLLLEIDEKRILTDPVWSGHASPVPIFAKRFFPPTLPLEKLPHLDLVLLSHDHYDHLDAPTIRKLARTSVPFVCSLGVGSHLVRWGVSRNRITELDWTRHTSLGDLTITALPARHFSGRFRRNRTLWSSFAIRGPRHSVFYGGDSGPFTEGFHEIGEAYGPFDLTMLEIGAYGPYWPEIHMGPTFAAEGHQALRGNVLLPIHWGLFNLAYHHWREPVELILQEAEQRSIKLLLPRPGEPVEVNGQDYISQWWEG